MGVWQPCMQGKNWQFHAKADQKSQITKQPEATASGSSRQLREIEGELIA